MRTLVRLAHQSAFVNCDAYFGNGTTIRFKSL
jgi:hypothetical protein